MSLVILFLFCDYFIFNCQWSLLFGDICICLKMIVIYILTRICRIHFSLACSIFWLIGRALLIPLHFWLKCLCIRRYINWNTYIVWFVRNNLIIFIINTSTDYISIYDIMICINPCIVLSFIRTIWWYSFDLIIWLLWPRIVLWARGVVYYLFRFNLLHFVLSIELLCFH